MLSLLPLRGPKTSTKCTKPILIKFPQNQPVLKARKIKLCFCQKSPIFFKLIYCVYLFFKQDWEPHRRTLSQNWGSGGGGGGCKLAYDNGHYFVILT